MKISTQQAAFLYLVAFNMGESGEEPNYDKMNPILAENNYPIVNDDLVFDNEGEPMVDWTWFLADFDWEEWTSNFLGLNDKESDGINELVVQAMEPNVDYEAILEEVELGYYSDGRPKN